MLLAVVWIVVAVLAVGVLGGVLVSLLGAVRRLRAEVAAVQRDVAPLLTEAQGVAARAASVGERGPDSD